MMSATAEIPYIVKPRADTGLYNAKFGVWLFLASEVMLFGSLFSSYILLRTHAPDWPRGSTILNVPLGALNTVVLITSSLTMIMAWLSLRMKEFPKFKIFLGATIFLAILFLSIKAYEYGHKFEHHHFPKTSTFYAVYFTLTGLHGIHVLAGILVNLYFLFPGSALWKTEPEQFSGRIECAGLYWHFVDLVWIFLFPVLYLL